MLFGFLHADDFLKDVAVAGRVRLRLEQQRVFLVLAVLHAAHADDEGLVLGNLCDVLGLKGVIATLQLAVDEVALADAVFTL